FRLLRRVRSLVVHRLSLGSFGAAGPPWTAGGSLPYSTRLATTSADSIGSAIGGVSAVGPRAGGPGPSPRASASARPAAAFAIAARCAVCCLVPSIATLFCNAVGAARRVLRRYGAT